MGYYYVLKLADKYNILDNRITEKYINKKRFKSFSDTNLHNLSLKTGRSFAEVLRNIFSAYLKIEREILKKLTKGYDKTEDIGKFRKMYLELLEKYDVETKHSTDLAILQKEDKNFMYEMWDNFLDDVEEESDSEDGNYNQVIILLNNNKEYIGHVYIWSWLRTDDKCKNLYTLKFSEIRTSVYNMITGKNIFNIFVNVIANWAKLHGYKYMEIGSKASTKTKENLKLCGLLSRNIINVNKIKCSIDQNYVQLATFTDVFSGVIDKSSFEEWYAKEKAIDDKLIRSTQLDYSAASDIHKLYKMTYPDRTPTKEELNNIYTLIYGNSSRDESFKKYKGLAFCHKESDKPLEKIFPTLDGLNIEWKYLDKKGEKSELQIKGDIFSPFSLIDASVDGGYDYIVMPFCPIVGGDITLLYKTVAPLLAAKCLLNNNGIILANNLMRAFIRLLDPDWDNAMSLLKSGNNVAAINLIRKIYPEFEPIDEEKLMVKALDKALNVKIIRLERDIILKDKFETFCQNIVNLAGFSSYQYTSSDYLISFRC